jgi:hypothetical protein
VKGAVPPEPVMGVNGVTAVFSVTDEGELPCVAETAVLTVMLVVAVAVAFVASVTVTV